MTTALVTGGAGFIGSHLVEALLAQGARVRVFDNLSTGRREHLAGLQVEWFVADVRDLSEVRRAARGVDHVFHLAAMISVAETMADPPACYAVNVLGSLNVLETARAEGVKRVVLASSAAVYGDAAGKAGEARPARPCSPYGASKLAMEQAARLYAEAYHLPTTCLRFFNVYGPRQRADSPYAAVIPQFIEGLLRGQPPAIYGDGHQTRDFVYVKDVARACLLAAEKAAGRGEALNIASGRSVSILDLYRTLQRLIPAASPPSFGPPRPGDIRHSRGDPRLARQALGYRPEVDLETGLRSTVQWFQETM